MTDEQYQATLTALGTAALVRARDALEHLITRLVNAPPTAESDYAVDASIATRAETEIGAALEILRATRRPPPPPAAPRTAREREDHLEGRHRPDTGNPGARP